MTLFSAGVFEEEELVSSLRKYVDRKAWRVLRRNEI
jgi:hypothetical protein